MLPQRIGRYRILCELGAGSMATLYLARMTGLGRFERLFAVKLTHEHLTKERSFVELFMNEARISAKIQHPNVIPVYEIDVERGRYYMVMDYVSGETLALMLEHTWGLGRPLAVEYAAQIVASACEGLHAAHELRDLDGPLGVVHRDVAPQNLMIGYDGIVRLMDFGVSKSTTSGVMKGTIAYLAPEQVRSLPADRRADVFALGTILWESTVGMRLFRHHSDVTTAARVMNMKVPRPSSLRADYPLELERIVMKALERRRELRYQSTREMGEELAELLLTRRARVTPGKLAGLMLELFADRREQRLLMEQRARLVEPPADLGYLPADAATDSLAVVNEDDAGDLEEPLRPGSAGAVPVFEEMEQVIPTLVVRDRALEGGPGSVSARESRTPVIAGWVAAAALLLASLLVWFAPRPASPPAVLRAPQALEVSTSSRAVGKADL